MTSRADLETGIRNTFKESWKSSDGRTVPATADIAMDNTARSFDLATFLYADLNGSTEMVSSLSWQRCAEIYKTYLYCASRMIRDHDGAVVAFDGDRVMGVFLGDQQSSNAAKCAMRINWILINLINPLYRSQYTDSTYLIGHTIGIDVGEARCCRTGIRGDNDLVWVGSAANIAAKLTALGEFPIWITDTLFSRLAPWAKEHNGQQMWEARTWTPMNNRRIYRSNWWWSID